MPYLFTKLFTLLLMKHFGMIPKLNLYFLLAYFVNCFLPSSDQNMDAIVFLPLFT